MDETLKALVEAADRGDDVPRVQVAVGLGLVSGVPIPHAEYADLQQQSIKVDLLKGRRIRRKEHDAVHDQAQTHSVSLAGFAQ